MRNFYKVLLSMVLATVLTFNLHNDFAIAADNSPEVNQNSEYFVYAATIDIDANSLADGEKKDLMSNKKIRIVNLGTMINHNNVDYAPTISADGRTLYFVSDKPGSVPKSDGDPSHDFWVGKKANRLDTTFVEVFNLDPSNALGKGGVNTILNEGAASIAADRQSLYFTGCNRDDGFGSCDIYKTTIEGDKWGRPVNLGKNVNAASFDTQPTITADQSRIYFASSRKGPNSNGDNTRENMDIWYSDWDDDLEEWKPAVNLTAINTKKEDSSPFIGADGVTLFFASGGHEPSFGGLDFYVTRFDPSADTWSKPENLGEPINTDGDEQFISLPASGDIIYFSSKRTDLPGAQGNLDVYMAFVPTFFKAANVIVTVVDECSGEFIPATISIKNPISGNIFKDEINAEKPATDRIITNDAYGDPKDSVKYINFEITAENPKYGKKTIVQRVNKPKITDNEADAGKVTDEDEYNVTIPLGQRPILSTEVKQGAYINRVKSEKPELASYNGLVMEEVLSWDLYPLLNYVFFDEGKAEIPERYNLFESADYTSVFNDTTIAGGTLDKYYHVLNIYGFRLTQNPKSNLRVIGCNDNVTSSEKGNKELSKKRAEVVYNYLRDVWKIEESRMKLEFRDFPETKSNPADSLGIQENRRVELICSDWDVVKPVFEKDPKIFPQPEIMDFVLNNGIEDDLVASRRIEVARNGQPWKVISDAGTTQSNVTWNWKSQDNKYPKDNVAYEAKLVVTTKSGAECISDPIEIPVMQVRSEDKAVMKGGDSLFENYSLILFKFNSFDAGPLNEKIMNDYVYARCQPTSNIKIIGHTDVVGLYETNKKLSENRAKTVFTGINKKTGGKYSSLDSKGVGEDDPIYSNDLPEGRFYNRTVQVLIATPLSAYSK